jgi:hypothetical protein
MSRTPQGSAAIPSGKAGGQEMPVAKAAEMTQKCRK